METKGVTFDEIVTTWKMKGRLSLCQKISNHVKILFYYVNYTTVHFRFQNSNMDWIQSYTHLQHYLLLNSLITLDFHMFDSSWFQNLTQVNSAQLKWHSENLQIELCMCRYFSNCGVVACFDYSSIQFVPRLG